MGTLLRSEALDAQAEGVEAARKSAAKASKQSSEPSSLALSDVSEARSAQRTVVGAEVDNSPDSGHDNSDGNQFDVNAHHNIDAVLEWVGDDKDRAREALAAEITHPDSRSSLVERLTALAG